MTQPKSTYFTYPTVHGPISICANARGITHVTFEAEKLDGVNQASELTNAAATQIQEYLAGKRRVFDVPIAPTGSAFQKEVWAQICELPYGTACTAADAVVKYGILPFTAEARIPCESFRLCQPSVVLMISWMPPSLFCVWLRF